MESLSRRTFTVAAAGALASAAAAGTARAATSADPGGTVSAAPAGAASRPGHPAAGRPAMRGVWVATVANTDWPSAPGLSPEQQRAELTALLDDAVERRMNAVVLQVRPTADAFWPSPYEPWSQYLTGTQGRSPGWDPLGTAVHEAHRRGLELHAWFNPYRISLTDDPGTLVPDHPARLHPEWVIAYGGQLYYDPGQPAVRRFVEDAMLDAVRRYPVDAVHWDDYFYPYPVAGQDFGDDASFARYGADFADRATWRRHNTDLLVSETARRIRQIRPTTQFGISPFGVWRNAAADPLGSATQAGVQTYDDLYADTRGWVRKGWLDYVAPQVYWNIGFAAADYAVLVPWWSDVVAGTRTKLYVGEAVYKVGAAGQSAAWQDPAELSRHLTFDADYPEVRGNIFYSATQVAADPLGAVTEMVADHWPTRVRAPR
jgi:uncharacterized lipoprotein YddW (UPF0748 family)